MSQKEIIQLLKNNRKRWFSVLDICEELNVTHAPVAYSIKKIMRYMKGTLEADIIIESEKVTRSNIPVYRYLGKTMS